MHWISPKRDYHVVLLGHNVFYLSGMDMICWLSVVYLISFRVFQNLLIHAARERRRAESREQVSWRMLIGGRAGDLVTPAHSHARLWGEIATPQRRISPFLSFRIFCGKKGIRFVKARGPDPFNILSVFYIVILDWLIDPWAPVGRNKRWSVFSVWLIARFYHRKYWKASFRCFARSLQGFFFFLTPICPTVRQEKKWHLSCLLKQ